ETAPTPISGGADIPDDLDNLFINPSFEGATRTVEFGEVSVFEGWEPFYCDTPYTPDKCDAPRAGNGNPPDLKMGRPEYKSSETAGRVFSGETAQQWFCFYRTCQAGVYQTVDTSPGATCEVTAYVQSWSSNTGGLTSDLITYDEKINSTWFIKVALDGGTNAFSEDVLSSRGFSYWDNIYDQYALISFQFEATDALTTVFFENLRIWPVANNDNYLDDVSIRCSE
ncbi:MAG: hypothetical protein GYB68_06480, partial [Chloroflexi bacterium]|nr:hypothetical protein [Chloroflexota bacterium]